MRDDCDVCRSEGFSSQNRVRVSCGERHIIATVHMVRSSLLHHDEAGLSQAAWQLLGASERDKAWFSHPTPVESMSYVRGKLYGTPFTAEATRAVIATYATAATPTSNSRPTSPPAPTACSTRTK